MGRIARLTVIALLLAGCRVDFFWSSDPSSDDAMFAPEPPVLGTFAVGSFADVTARHPRERVHLLGWKVQVEPAHAARELRRQVRGDELEVRLRFEAPGRSKVEIRRPGGALADAKWFDAAVATRVELDTWIAERTGRVTTPLLADDGALHLAAGGEAVGIYTRFFDRSGRYLLARGLVGARAVGAARVTNVLDDAIDVVASDLPGTGRLHVFAHDRLLREIPLVVHGFEELTRVSIVSNDAGPRDGAGRDDRKGWLVGVARAGRYHTWGADVTWWEDDRWLGEGAFAEVIADEGRFARTRVVTACLGDLPPGPPPVDGATTARRSALTETDAPGDTDAPADTDPGDTDPGDTDAPADTDPGDTDEPADTDPGDTDEPADTDPGTDPRPICDTVTIRGRIGGLGDDRTGSFCGCDHVPAGGAAGALALLVALGLRRRR